VGPRFDDSTPLHYAVLAGDFAADLCALLLDAGADPNAPNRGGATPLCYAQSPEMVQLLVRAGAGVNPVNPPRSRALRSPLHDAVNPEVCRALIAAGASLDARGILGLTPLQSTRSEEVALVLIQAGADVDVYDSYSGYKPIHGAQSAAVVAALVARGASLHERTRYCQAIATNTKTRPSSSIGDVEPVRPCAGMTPLHTVRDVGAVQALLDAGADPNAPSDVCRGLTPLHVVRSLEVCRLLLAAGAAVNARAQDGKLPVHAVQDWASWQVGDRGWCPVMLAWDAALGVELLLVEPPSVFAPGYPLFCVSSAFSAGAGGGRCGCARDYQRGRHRPALCHQPRGHSVPDCGWGQCQQQDPGWCVAPHCPYVPWAPQCQAARERVRYGAGCWALAWFVGPRSASLQVGTACSPVHLFSYCGRVPALRGH
jgi:ankyrin repeat protein